MKIKVLIAAAALIFVIGIACSIFVLCSPSKSIVNIVRDSSNTVEIKDGKIRVSEAECPDKTCVRTGWLSFSAMPIVCLPNHLIIEFADENSEIDALAE